VKLAKRQGFRVRLIYVTLKSVELNVQRARMRVAKGGHDVPEEKIADRRRRSFGELPWFLANADEAEVLDNSSERPELLISKSDNVIEVFADLLPELNEAIDRAMTGNLDPSFRS
jgi:predicted ABC-type ATPase